MAHSLNHTSWTRDILWAQVIEFLEQLGMSLHVQTDVILTNCMTCFTSALWSLSVFS